jgi:ABC-type nitrate/sulfonate/bicarbonate transport system permease component
MRRRPVGTIRTHTVVHLASPPVVAAEPPPPDNVAPAPAKKAQANPARGLFFGLILSMLLFHHLFTSFLTTLAIVGGVFLGLVIGVLIYGAATARQ